VVAAEFVCAGDGLRERDIGGGCRVYFYGGGARCREDLSRRYSQGEDVGDVGWWDVSFGSDGGVDWRFTIVNGVRCEILFRLEGVSTCHLGEGKCLPLSLTHFMTFEGGS
jgi:hypothetical protein